MQQLSICNWFSFSSKYLKTTGVCSYRYIVGIGFIDIAMWGRGVILKVRKKKLSGFLTNVLRFIQEIHRYHVTV